MKAKELIEVLQKHPEADILIGYEEVVQLSEYTSDTETIESQACEVYLEKDKIIISDSAYLRKERLWPV